MAESQKSPGPLERGQSSKPQKVGQSGEDVEQVMEKFLGPKRCQSKGDFGCFPIPFGSKSIGRGNVYPHRSGEVKGCVSIWRR